MTEKEYKDFWEAQVAYRRKLLCVKSKEYGEQLSRFSNFLEISQMAGESPEKVAMILMMKHFIGIRNVCKGLVKDDINLTRAKLKEKFNDSINYLDLMHGLILEVHNIKAPLFEMYRVNTRTGSTHNIQAESILDAIDRSQISPEDIVGVYKICNIDLDGTKVMATRKAMRELGK